MRRFGLMAVIFFAAAAAIAQPADAPRAPGKLIYIGGRRLHLNCTGNGPQTVVVENGEAAFSIDWALVQPGVAKFARICTYDRAGYAWSDPGPAPDMVAQIADDLHLLLRTAKLRPPYVLVGASIGGFYVRAYQRRYPDEVSGMVMVDTTTEESFAWNVDGKPKPAYAITREELDGVMKKLLENPKFPPPKPAALEQPFDRLPKNLQSARDWAAARYSSPRYARLPQVPASSEATRQEFVAQRAIRIASEHPLGRLPLIVLTAGGRVPNPTRISRHAEIAHLSSIGKLLVAENSGHEIHLYRPDLVIQAIRDVLSLTGTK